MMCLDPLAQQVLDIWKVYFLFWNSLPLFWSDYTIEFFPHKLQGNVPKVCLFREQLLQTEFYHIYASTSSITKDVKTWTVMMLRFLCAYLNAAFSKANKHTTNKVKAIWDHHCPCNSIPRDKEQGWKSKNRLTFMSLSILHESRWCARMMLMHNGRKRQGDKKMTVIEKKVHVSSACGQLHHPQL